MNPNIQSLVGHEINDYHIEQFIGQGLTGAVFRAVKRDPAASTPATPIALKVFFPAIGMNNDERTRLFKRFEQEATILKNLHHPNILAILDYGKNELYTYIALPLATGGTLADRMALGMMPLAEVLRLLRQIAAGLDYAHEQHVIHRDIKPSNILLDAQNNALIGDFSIAKQLGSALTSSISRNNIMGTFQYMAPEQANSDAVTPATDLYSLAVVTYQMVTGEIPFGGDSSIAVFFNQLINRSPPPPRTLRADLPEPADAVIMKALSKAPGDRFPSATAFVEALALGLQNQWPANVTPFVVGAGAGLATGPLPVLPATANVPSEPTIPTGPNVFYGQLPGQFPTGPLPTAYPPHGTNTGGLYAPTVTGPLGQTGPYFGAPPAPPQQQRSMGPLIAGLASALLVLTTVFVLFGLGIIPPKGSTNSFPIAGGDATATSTVLPSPTFTTIPTNTIPPTYTLQPTYTLEPTYTPRPTYTPQPTTPPPSSPGCPSGFNCIDDSQITYVGPWQSDVGKCSCYNGTQHFIGTTWGAMAGNTYGFVAFNGSQILYFAVVDNQNGFMALYLDGNFAGNVDLYSPNRRGFVQVWNSGGLATGNHVLQLVYTNTRNGASSDSVVTIDAFAYR